MAPTTSPCSAAVVAALSAIPTLATAETFAPKIPVMAIFEAEAVPWLRNLDLLDCPHRVVRFEW